MDIFNSPDFDDHEQVVFCRDRHSGLTAIIALHDTTLGPAVGGCRMWPYASEAEAVRDVLRLSRGMTGKAALAGLAMGGGKSVIIGDPKRDKTRALLTAMARSVDRLAGRYRIAEDVGTGVADIEVMRATTRHVAGVAGGCGDPSPYTARGVHAGIRAAVAHRLGQSTLQGVRIAVQGLGHVGMQLVERLAADGAILTVADLDPVAAQSAADRLGGTIADPIRIHAAPVDVFAPCALGGVINDASIEDLKCSVVAGAANNQLAEPRHGAALADLGILYAPDYVINAGGLIGIGFETIDADGHASHDRPAAEAKAEAIGQTLADLFARARRDGITPADAADRQAAEVVDAARQAGHRNAA